MDEQKLAGEPSSEAPKREPDEECNGKRVRGSDPPIFQGYCNRSLGWGTDHVGEGRCRQHGGNNGGAREGAGAPKGNQNAQKHALNSDPENYYDHVDDAEQERIWELSESIIDRVRQNGNRVDILDRKLARRVSIKIHIADHATDYALRDGLMQTIEIEDDGAEYEKEIPHALLDDLRQYDAEVFRELKKLGALDDPDSQMADALSRVTINETRVTEDNVDEFAE